MAEIKVKRSSVPGKIPLVGDLALGEIAINTYDGIAYIKKDVSGTQTIVSLGGSGDNSAFQNRYTYTATSGQTTFAASYTAPFVDVYLNGTKLVAVSDYTASNGTTIILGVPATVDDTVEIIGYTAFSVAIITADGGSAASVYLISQTLDGGGA